MLAARRELLAPALSARSDHVALVLAYGRWAEAHARGGRSAAAALATGAGLSDSGLEAVAAGRGEYARVLSDLGFLDWQVRMCCAYNDIKILYTVIQWIGWRMNK